MDALGAVPVARGREGYLAIDRAEELIRAGRGGRDLSRGLGAGVTRGRVARRGSRSRRAFHSSRSGSSAPARALSRGRVGLPRIRIVVGEPIPVEQSQPTVAAARELTRILQERVEAL